MAFKSRFVRASICPDPISEPEAFVAHLISWSKRHETKPVVFVTSDDYVQVLAANREELDSCYLLNIPSEEILRTIVSKWEQVESAASLGISTPRTVVFNCEDDLTTTRDDMIFPVFLKGLYTPEWRRVFGGTRKGFVVGNIDEMRAKVGEALKQGVRVLAQEIVQGPDTNNVEFHSYFSISGDPLAVFTFRKLRQHPINFGIGCAVESNDDPELVDVGLRYFKGLGYRGAGQAEFKRDERDGKLKLIELNPRYWQQIALTTACGINIPLVQYLDLTGQPLPPINEVKIGFKWINIYMDVQSFLGYRREGELGVKDWLKSLVGPGMLSDFAWDDPGPFLYEMKYGKVIVNSLWRLAKSDL